MAKKSAKRSTDDDLGSIVRKIKNEFSELPEAGLEAYLRVGELVEQAVKMFGRRGRGFVKELAGRCGRSATTLANCREFHKVWRTVERKAAVKAKLPWRCAVELHSYGRMANRLESAKDHAGAKKPGAKKLRVQMTQFIDKWSKQVKKQAEKKAKQKAKQKAEQKVEQEAKKKTKKKAGKRPKFKPIKSWISKVRAWKHRNSRIFAGNRMRWLHAARDRFNSGMADVTKATKEAGKLGANTKEYERILKSAADGIRAEIARVLTANASGSITPS